MKEKENYIVKEKNVNFKDWKIVRVKNGNKKLKKRGKLIQRSKER